MNTICCCVVCCFSIAVSCIFVTVERATVVLSMFFEVCRLYGGFFTSPAQLRDHYGWKFADALSYIKYVYVGVALNEFEGATFSCTQAQVNALKCTATGEAVIAAKGYDAYSIDGCFGLLVLYIVLARFIGFIALRFIKE